MEQAWPEDLPWMAAKEELRAINVHLNSTAAEPSFVWRTIQLSARDLPSLVRLDEEFLGYVKRCQQEAYTEDLSRLQEKKPLRSTSNLLSFTPILDEDGVIWLGGRLSRAKLPRCAAQPMLPRKYPFSRKIIRAFHESMLHVGTDFVQESKRVVPCKRALLDFALLDDVRARSCKTRPERMHPVSALQTKGRSTNHGGC